MREYTFNEMTIGLSESFETTVTEEMIQSFGIITGDLNPLHTDLEYALSKGYSNRVVYGMLTASLISTMAGMFLPGKYSLINKEEMLFKKPVFVGDTLKVTGKVIERNEKFHFVVLKVTIKNQNDETVIIGKMDVGVTA